MDIDTSKHIQIYTYIAMPTHQIYTDSETDRDLQRIKEIEPEFNLSNFVKSNITNLREDLEKKSNNKHFLEIKKIETLEKIDQFTLKLKQIEEAINRKTTDSKEKENNEDSKKERRIKDYIHTFREMYDIQDPIFLRQLAEEFFNEFNKTGVNILDFMENKGYKEIGYKEIE